MESLENISLNIDDKLLSEFKTYPKNNKVDDFVKLNLGLGLFVSGEVSLAAAAGFSQKSLAEFMEILERLDIPSASYTEDMLENDLKLISGISV